MQPESPNQPLQLDTRFALSPASVMDALVRAQLLSDEWCEPSLLKQRTAHEPLRLVWDSRELPTQKRDSSVTVEGAATERCLFIARVGHRFNAHALAEDLLAAGHLFVGCPREFIALASKERPEAWIRAILTNPNFIPVDDCDEALQLLLTLASKLDPSQFRSIAMTGTSGKTSATQLCGALLERLTAAATMRIGTLGIQAGNRACEGAYPTMPDYPGFVAALTTARRLNIHDVVFEATSHGLIERRMGRWLCDVAVFTNFSQDHLDFHKTMEAYRSCKGILFEEHLKEGGHAVLNADDKEWIYFARRSPRHAATVWGYGSPGQRDAFLAEAGKFFSSVRYLAITKRVCTHRSISGSWKVTIPGQPTQTADYELPLLGDFQHSNLAAAVSALLALNFPLAAVAREARALRGIPGRLQPVLLDMTTTYPAVLVDYAHKPDALEKTLLTLQGLKGSSRSKLICLFGCGGDRDATKRPIMGKIAAELADLTIVTSDNPRTEDPEVIIDQIFAGIPEPSKVLRESDRRRAIILALAQAAPDDIVVLAGKGHEDYQIIGTTKRHFSDYEEAESALRHWLGTRGKG
jgi:UDP-N-acetylmuramoyl-L-alanyl-D-glutamate--2,6-diaminopimelate ligase